MKDKYQAYIFGFLLILSSGLFYIAKKRSPDTHDDLHQRGAVSKAEHKYHFRSNQKRINFMIGTIILSNN